MTITHLRWTILGVSFLLLSFGGLIGVSLGQFFPAFSCYYVDSRGGTCFLWVMQHLLDHGYWGALKALGVSFICFSLLAIIAGRLWCGWICPLGLIQDLLDLLRKQLGIGYLTFPERLREQLRCVKWIFLFIALLVPLWVAFPVFAPSVAADLHQPLCQLCPGKYILPLVVGDPADVAVNFKSTTTVVMSALGLFFSGLVILFSMVKRRFLCPYCPMGLLLSRYRKISLVRLKKDCGTCTMCEVCYNVCPVEIKQIFKEREAEDVTFADCTLCLRCVEHCPEDGALRATFLGRTFYKSSSRGFFSRRYAPPEK